MWIIDSGTTNGVQTTNGIQTTPSTKSNSTDLTIGLSVGIPLLVLLIVVAFIIFYYIRKFRPSDIPRNDENGNKFVL